MTTRKISGGEKLTDLFFLLSVFAGLSIIYSKDTSVYWAYMGFPGDFSLTRFLLSLGALVAISFFVSRKVTVRSFFFLIAIYAYIIPALIVFYMGGGSYIHASLILAGFLALWGMQNVHITRVRLPSLSRKGLLVLCLTLTVFTVIIFAAFGAYRHFNLNIFRVYEFRSETASNLPRLFGYIMSPVSKVILPIGIVLGIFYKSRTTVILFIILTIIFFGLTHHKSVLAAPLFIVLIYSLLQRVQSLYFLHLFFVLIVLIGLIEYVVIYFLAPMQQAGMFSSFVIRRVLFLPPLLDQFYTDYFSSRDFIYWANSRISFGLVTTDYDVVASHLIGEEYFGSVDTGANTGFIGSGFSNAGFLGVILYGIIIGSLISLIESYGRALGQAVVISASSILLISILTSTDLVTSFLTHGLLFLLLLLSIMPKPREITGKH